MFIFVGLILIAVFLMLSAFWSASEIALNSLSKYRVKKLIVLKKTIAEPLIRWLDSPYYLLTVILTGNIISDMMISFLSTAVSLEAFHMINRGVVEFFTWLITTFVVLIIGEITPKIYSRANSQKVALFAVPILSKIEYITKPFMFPFVKILNFIFDKHNRTRAYPILSKDEVNSLISEAGQDGVFDKDISVMLEKSLWFGELSVLKIMTPFHEIESVKINQDNEKFIDSIVGTSRSRVPVYENVKSNIIGYIHIQDVLSSWQSNDGKFLKTLVKPAFFINQDENINELLKELQSGRTYIAFVKNYKGAIVGMVTLEDIIEEIVGEILDEYEL